MVVKNSNLGDLNFRWKSQKSSYLEICSLTVLDSESLFVSNDRCVQIRTINIPSQLIIHIHDSGTSVSSISSLFFNLFIVSFALVIIILSAQIPAVGRRYYRVIVFSRTINYSAVQQLNRVGRISFRRLAHSVSAYTKRRWTPIILQRYIVGILQKERSVGPAPLYLRTSSVKFRMRPSKQSLLLYYYHNI